MVFTKVTKFQRISNYASLKYNYVDGSFEEKLL